MIRLIVCLLFLYASAGVFAAPTRDNSSLDVSSHTSSMRSRTSPFVLNANIGFVNYLPTIKPGYWYPLWAIIEAKEVDIDGLLIFEQNRNSLRVVIPARVAKGEKKMFRSAYRPVALEPQIKVEFRNNRTGSETFTVNCISVEEGSRQVLIVTEETGAFGFLRRQSESQALDARGKPINELHVQYGALGLLPDDPILLESLDAIVLDGAHLRAMRTEQWDAIQTWVAMGGRLLIGTGRNQPFVQQSVLKDPFGITFASPAAADGRDIFSALKTTQTAQQVMVAWPSLAQGAWDTIWIGDSARAFLAGRRVGRGFVAVCAAALDMELLKTINGEPDSFHIWGEMLGRARASTPLMEIARQEEGKLSLGLQLPFGFGMASAWWVAAYLGLYVVLALPAAWVVSARLRRRGWFWLAAAALALGFSWYGYNSGSLSRERSILLNEATLISRPAATGPARAVTLSSVYAPWRFRKDLRVGARTLVCESKPESRYLRFRGVRNTDLYSDRPMIASFGATCELRDFAIYPSSARNLRTDFTAAIEGGITVLAPIQGVKGAGSLSQGRLRNSTPWTFARWWITDGQNKVWAPRSALRAGAEHNFAAESAAIARVAERSRSAAYQMSPRGNSIPADVPYFRDVFGQSFATEFLRTPVGNERTYRDFRSDEANWNWAVDVNPWQRMDGSLLFIGECDGAISPAIEPLHLNSIRRRLYYEQGLDNGDLPGARQAAAQPSSWQAKVMNETFESFFSNQGYRSSRNEPYDTNNVLIYLLTVDVILFPDCQYYPKSGDSAEISLCLKDYPEALREYTLYRGSPREHSVKMPEGTHVAGCPVSIYNCRQDKWEPAGVWTGQPFVLKNLIEYMQPANSAIMLRLDATPDEVRYSVASNSAGTTSIITTGKALFGEQTPYLTQSQNARYRSLQPYQKGPSVAVLSDLKVKIIPSENKAENPQEGARR